MKAPVRTGACPRPHPRPRVPAFHEGKGAPLALQLAKIKIKINLLAVDENVLHRSFLVGAWRECTHGSAPNRQSSATRQMAAPRREDGGLTSAGKRRRLEEAPVGGGARLAPGAAVLCGWRRRAARTPRDLGRLVLRFAVSCARVAHVRRNHRKGSWLVS